MLFAGPFCRPGSWSRPSQRCFSRSRQGSVKGDRAALAVGAALPLTDLRRRLRFADDGRLRIEGDVWFLVSP